MTWTPVGPLVLVWWNTSLSPPVPKRKASDADLDFVVKQVREIYEQTGFDVLALGEVCSADLSAIVTGIGESHLSVHDATDRTGKRMFDTAVIYDTRKVELTSNRSIEDKYARKTLKTGEVVTFRAVQTGEQFQLVVSHWPSRITAPDFDPMRAELGTALRRSIEAMREEGATPYTILMGDYNDEPFSRALAEHLLATRDRSLARRDSRYFYNPFWKSIGESHDGPRDDENGICGTHFYPNGNSSRWFTYDQIIFSSEFLAGEAMSLNERLCAILVPPALRSKLLVRREIFDHLPVLGTVELRSKT
jgi:endonuclease/exonuclease/phosphatase family metal-dependent hydrolase